MLEKNVVNDHILVVDDDVEVRSLVADVLGDEGYAVEQASDGTEAFSIIKNTECSLVFLDLWIGEDEGAGLKILSKLKKLYPEIPVVIISGHGTIDVAVKAIQDGAFDFIEKPFVIDRLLITAQRAIENFKLKKENNSLRGNKLDVAVLSAGKSSFSQNVKAMVEKSAQFSRILIQAAPGSGANILAYAIHKSSQRKGPFVYVNCSMEPERLDQSLFGTEKSYGLIERANTGTLFLEDISKLSNDAQNRLLQFMQNDYYEAGARKAYSNVHIICSTSVSLKEAIKNREFNEELFNRLNIGKVAIPPLSERREDIIPLIQYFVSKSDLVYGFKHIQFSKEAISTLQAFDWPGNIRQLQNAVENALINAEGLSVIGNDSLPPEITASTQNRYKDLDVAKLISLPLKEAKERFERDYLKAQIDRFSGNVSQTANFVGMERSALHRKLKTLDIDIVRKGKNKEGTE